MYICERCGCRCDAGELHAGICDDCLEADRQQEERQEQERKMREMCIMEQPGGQLVFSF